MASSAAYRIAFVYSGAFALGLAMLGVIVFWAMHLAFTRQLDAMIAEEAADTERRTAAGGDGELAEAIAQRESVACATVRYAVFAPTGGASTARCEPSAALGVQDIAFIEPRRGAR